MASETPLLQGFELQIQTEEENQLLTHKSVKYNYDLMISNDSSLDCKLDALTEILGGIDNIVGFYLSQNDALSTTQLTQINDIILSTTSEHKQVDTTNADNCDNTIKLKRSDTFYHSIFNETIADKINKILFSKPMGIYIGILLICFIINYVAGDETVPWFQWPLEILASSLLISLLLSVNKSLCRRMVFSFEFLVKIVYAIRLFLCKILARGDPDVPEYIGDSNYIFLVATISLIDGIEMNRKAKIVLVGLVSALYSTYAVVYTFFHEPLLFNLFGKWKLDIIAMEASSYRVIALFAWAQTYRLIVGTNMSTMIAKPFKIQWVD